MLQYALQNFMEAIRIHFCVMCVTLTNKIAFLSYIQYLCLSFSFVHLSFIQIYLILHFFSIIYKSTFTLNDKIDQLSV